MSFSHRFFTNPQKYSNLDEEKDTAIEIVTPQHKHPNRDEEKETIIDVVTPLTAHYRSTPAMLEDLETIESLREKLNKPYYNIPIEWCFFSDFVPIKCMFVLGYCSSWIGLLIVLYKSFIHPTHLFYTQVLPNYKDQTCYELFNGILQITCGGTYTSYNLTSEMQNAAITCSNYRCDDNESSHFNFGKLFASLILGGVFAAIIIGCASAISSGIINVSRKFCFFDSKERALLSENNLSFLDSNRYLLDRVDDIYLKRLLENRFPTVVVEMIMMKMATLNKLYGSYSKKEEFDEVIWEAIQEKENKQVEARFSHSKKI